MGNQTSLIDKDTLVLIWRVYFILGIVQGALALFLILTNPSETGTALIWGLSTARTIFVFGILFVLFIFGWLLLESWVKPNRNRQRIDQLIAFINRPMPLGVSLLLSGIIFLGSFFFITLLPEITEPFTLGNFKRLYPFVIWATGLSAQTLAALLIIRFRSNPLKLIPRGTPFYLTLLAFTILFLLWPWVVREVMPIETSAIGWNHLGVPLIETQLLLAWSAGMGMLVVITLANNKDRYPRLINLGAKRVDLLIGFLLWLGSVLLWQSIPIENNWFVSEPAHPNFEFYPISDARTYDTAAQSALIGEGYRYHGSPYVRRSMHALFLTILHLIAGQDYETVAFLQILVLALLPPVVYLLTKELHNRISAVAAGVLIMVREANSISIGGRITASHAKLLMVDLPTALAVASTAYLSILWFKQIENRKIYALVTGGILGIGLLIRFETIVLSLPIAAISAYLLLSKKQFALWLKQLLLFSLGIALVISPWIWRNWALTGEIYIDSPVFRFGLIAQRFHPYQQKPPELVGTTPQPQLTPTPKEDLQEPVIIQTPHLSPTAPVEDAERETGSDELPDFFKYSPERAISLARDNPQYVASFMLGHLLNSQLQTAIYFPTTFRAVDSVMGFIGHRSLKKFWNECCSLDDYVRRMPYWHHWDGNLPNQAIVPLFVLMIFLAVGINETWRRHGLTGITPLIMGVAYISFNAFFRNSGGRYILPIDWISVIYYCIGLTFVSIKFLGFVLNKKIPESLPEQRNPLQSPILNKDLSHSWKFYGIIVFFLLLGCAVPLVENSFQQLYPETRKNEMLAKLMDSELISEQMRTSLETFLSQGGVAIAGRGLYPRFIPATTGDLTKKDQDLEPVPYHRFSFFIAGPTSANMIIPISKKPLEFPNASDILVFGCLDEKVLAVALFDDSGSPKGILARSPFPQTLSCPLPEIVNN